MDKVMLQVNDIFSQAWKGCQKPMWFRILNIDRITNSIEWSVIHLMVLMYFLKFGL